LNFEVIMKDFRGNMSLAVPSVISSALLRKLAVTRPRFYTRLGSAGAALQLRQRLLGCFFRPELGLALTASAAELAKLAPGAVLTFARKSGEPAELFAEHRPMFQAQVARRGNSRAARIIAAVKDKEMEQKPL
jgi:flagellar motor switch protein FliM